MIYYNYRMKSNQKKNDKIQQEIPMSDFSASFSEESKLKYQSNPSKIKENPNPNYMGHKTQSESKFPSGKIIENQSSSATKPKTQKKDTEAFSCVKGPQPKIIENLFNNPNPNENYFKAKEKDTVFPDKNLTTSSSELYKSTRQQTLKNLDISIDKNSRFCNSCSLPIDPSDISILFLCSHSFCYICFYNRLQEIIAEEIPQLMTCNCNKVVYYYLFGENLDTESLELYIEMISKISILDNSSHSLCPYDIHINKKLSYKTFIKCDECQMEYCVKCGQYHKNQTCFENYEQNYKLELLSKKPKCTQCNNNPLEIELPCECKLCITCAKDIITDFLYNISQIDDPKCKTHQLIIPRMDIYKSFGGEHMFIREQEKAIDYMILAPKFICEICLNENNVDKSITLECEHRFCSDCMKNYLNTLMIDSSSVGRMVCPKCNVEIPYDIIKSNSEPQVFERYLNFTVMAYQPKKSLKDDEEEVMKWCIKCNFGCLISIYDKQFQCPNCKSECCPKCNKKHYFGTCEDLRKSMTPIQLKTLLGHRDDYFNNLMKNCCKCPNCREAIEKAYGCNFIECKWPRCKEVYFCAICNKRLRVRDI